MQQGRRDSATGHDTHPERETRSNPHRRKRSDRRSEMAPGVIVVGSTTTALLVEALAQAGMLRCSGFPSDFPCRRAVVRRAATWSEVAECAAAHAPCAVVTTRAIGAPPPMRDAAGGPVQLIEAEALLEESRRTARTRGALTAVKAGTWTPLGWFDELREHLRPRRATGLARRHG